MNTCYNVYCSVFIFGNGYLLRQISIVERRVKIQLTYQTIKSFSTEQQQQQQ